MRRGPEGSATRRKISPKELPDRATTLRAGSAARVRRPTATPAGGGRASEDMGGGLERVGKVRREEAEEGGTRGERQRLANRAGEGGEAGGGAGGDARGGGGGANDATAETAPTATGTPMAASAASAAVAAEAAAAASSGPGARPRSSPARPPAGDAGTRGTITTHRDESRRIGTRRLGGEGETSKPSSSREQDRPPRPHPPKIPVESPIA